LYDTLPVAGNSGLASSIVVPQLFPLIVKIALSVPLVFVDGIWPPPVARTCSAHPQKRSAVEMDKRESMPVALGRILLDMVSSVSVNLYVTGSG